MPPGALARSTVSLPASSMQASEFAVISTGVRRCSATSNPVVMPWFIETPAGWERGARPRADVLFLAVPVPLRQQDHDPVTVLPEQRAVARSIASPHFREHPQRAGSYADLPVPIARSERGCGLLGELEHPASYRAFSFAQSHIRVSRVPSLLATRSAPRRLAGRTPVDIEEPRCMSRRRIPLESKHG